MASQDSFGAKSTLDVGGKAYEIYRLDAVTGDGLDVERPAVQPEGPAREPAAHRGRRRHHRRPHPGARRLGRRRRARQGDPVHAGARDHAGLHRACPASSTWRPCARRWPTSAATPPRSTRSPRPSWSSTTPSSPTSSAPRRRSSATSRSSTSATASATSSCAGARAPSRTSRSSRPAPASCTRSTSSTWPAWSSPARSTASSRRTPTPASAPTPTPRWSTASAWSAGASAASRPRPRCSASRSSMLIPRVVGFKLNGDLPEGATATDLVLTITEMLRKHGVVGKFVEFYGPGVSALPLANRATIGNMSPEFGSTIAVFPIDQQTLDYLELTGRPAEQLALVEAYAKEQGLWHDPDAEPRFSEKLELDLSTVVPSLAGPKRPQDRVALSDAKQTLPRRARRLRRRTARRGGGVRRVGRGVLPGLRLAVPRGRQRLGGADRPPGDDSARPAPAAAARPTRRRSPSTARVRGRPRRGRRSPRSPPAPTPPTRR